MPGLLTGTVTFLFTDIEGSTRFLEQLGDRYAEVLGYTVTCQMVERNDRLQVGIESLFYPSWIVILPGSVDPLVTSRAGSTM